MKYCPKCRAAYTDQYEICHRCERVLVNQLKGKNRIGNLVSVYRNIDPTPVDLIKDMLEENNIKCIVKKPNPSRINDEFRDEIEILVKQEDQKKVEGILKKA